MIDPQVILDAAAELFNVEREQIAHGSRGNDRMIGCRQAIAYVLATHEYTSSEIGAILGRDHSTISNALRRARERISSDAVFAGRVRALAAVAGAEAPRLQERTVAETPEKRRASWLIAPDVHIAAFWWGVREPPAA